MCGREFEKLTEGMVLLEALFSMALALMIIAALTRIYVNLRGANRLPQSVQNHISAAQQIKSILSDEVHAAGYIGCSRLKNTFPVYSKYPEKLTANNFIFTTESALTVRYQSFPGAVLLHNMTAASLVADSTLRFKPGQLLVISDCTHAEIFRVGRIIYAKQMQIITPEKPLLTSFHQYAEIGHLINRQYYLRKSSLMRRDTEGQLELVQGTDHVRFARDNNGIYYEFTTVFAGHHKLWRGYIHCFACAGAG